jgi:NAD(P)-dependent dehydrogenase (short-subunit alcohol dehydrogenase family)
MKIEHAAVLVTGANRGIGRALVEEALERGAEPWRGGVLKDLERQNAALLHALSVEA